MNGFARLCVADKYKKLAGLHRQALEESATRRVVTIDVGADEIAILSYIVRASELLLTRPSLLIARHFFCIPKLVIWYEALLRMGQQGTKALQKSTHNLQEILSEQVAFPH